MHKLLSILLNAFDRVLLYYRTVKRLLIPVLQIRVHNGTLFLLFLIQNICCGYLNGPIKWDGSFEDQKHSLTYWLGKHQISILWKIALLDLCGIQKCIFRRNAILVALLYSGFISSTIQTISIQNSNRIPFGCKTCVFLNDTWLWFPD